MGSFSAHQSHLGCLLGSNLLLCKKRREVSTSNETTHIDHKYLTVQDCLESPFLLVRNGS